MFAAAVVLCILYQNESSLEYEISCVQNCTSLCASINHQIFHNFSLCHIFAIDRGRLNGILVLMFPFSLSATKKHATKQIYSYASPKLQFELKYMNNFYNFLSTMLSAFVQLSDDCVSLPKQYKKILCESSSSSDRSFSLLLNFYAPFCDFCGVFYI